MLAQWSTGGIAGKKREDLLETIEPVIGVKVMVASSIATDLDITNGARGTVVNIVLSPKA